MLTLYVVQWLGQEKQKPFVIMFPFFFLPLISERWRTITAPFYATYREVSISGHPARKIVKAQSKNCVQRGPNQNFLLCGSNIFLRRKALSRNFVGTLDYSSQLLPRSFILHDFTCRPFLPTIEIVFLQSSCYP